MGGDTASVTCTAMGGPGEQSLRQHSVIQSCALGWGCGQRPSRAVH